MIHYHLESTFEILGEPECEALLAQQSIGRIAYMDDEFPVVLPVNYTLAEGLLVFRTDKGSKLDHIPMRRVAFQIDGFDNAETAWSVLVQGYAQEVTNAVGERYERLRATHLPTFAPGDKHHWIAIDIAHISGRRITAVAAADEP